MLSENIQENTSDMGGFLNGREQERYSLPLAPFFKDSKTCVYLR